MDSSKKESVTTQIHQIYIRATPEAIWSGRANMGIVLEGAPLMAAATASKFNGRGGGGWSWIISDLKSLLETGRPLSG